MPYPVFVTLLIPRMADNAIAEMPSHIVIRPSLRNVRFARPNVAWLGGLPLLALSIAMLVKATSHDASFAWVGGGIIVLVFLVALVAVCVGEWLYGRNASLFIAGDVVGMTDLWGRTTARPLEEWKCLEMRRTLRSLGNGAKMPVAKTRFVSVADRTMFEITGREFRLEDLRRMCDAVHVPMVGSWDA